MKHKILTFALALLTAASAGAYDFKVDGLCYNILSSTEVEVTYENIESETSNYPALSGAVNIPASVTYENNEYNVTGIGYAAFAYCNAISSVNTPNNVTSIGDYAFYGCSSLQSVNIPNSVTSIGEYAFEYCSSLQSVTLPDNITSIETGTFAYCGLTSITLSENVTNIGEIAFAMCQQLAEINVQSAYPPTITSSTFVGISYSVTINVPEGSENNYLGDPNWKALFDMASGEVSGTCGDNLTWNLNFTTNTLTISGTGYMHYYSETPWSTYRSYINTLHLPEGLANITSSAFRNCFNLTTVTIPSTVEAIDDQAFAACYGLNEIIWNAFACYQAWNIFEDSPIRTVTFGESVQSIPDGTFSIPTLTAINVLATNPPTITASTFRGINTSATISVPESSREAYLADPNWKRLLDMASGEISGTFGENQSLTWTLTFADSTLTISGTGEMGYINEEESWKAFSSSIAKVLIEEGVTSINYEAFRYHENLRDVTIPGSVTRIGSDAFYGTALYYNENNWTNGALYIDNCLIESSEQQMSETGHFTIADGTRIIANDAFRNRSWLTGVTLPNSVTSICAGAFYGCSQLTQITLPAAVTYIGSEAFAECSLTTITLLTTTPPDITSSTFNGLTPSATITIPEGSRDAYLADPNWKRLLDMASGEISGTFGDNQNLTWTLTFADSTLTISGTGEMGYIYYNWPWEGFENYIAKVIMEEGVTNIANGAFFEHRNLREVTIPSSVTSIESDAFNGTAFYNYGNNWPNGALYIDNCLIKINEWQIDETGHFTVADGTRLIADEAFSYRSWLTGVTLPNSVTNIGERAFDNCSQLTQITIPSAVTHIGSEAFARCSLNTITVLATTPPTITTNTFSGLIPSATITIPEGSRDAYLADPNWKRLLDMASGEISGTFGENQNLIWTLTFADSTLTITGTGAMGYIDSENSWEAFSSSIAKVVIEEGVTSIANGAFSNHENVREVTIPGSVTSIGAYAFNGTALYYNENNWTNGGLYIDNCLIVIGDWQLDETGHFTVADGTRIIADEAFRYRSWLMGVTIPNSVTYIGEYILSECENLASITVLATTPPVITSYTFEGVNTGIQVTIPEGSTALYEADPLWNSFLQFCTGIISGTCGENLTWTLTLADNTLTISGTGDMYNYLWGANPLPWEQYRSYINTVNIAEGVTSISGGAFSNSNLNSINIPNSINKIGESAFVGTQLYYDDSNWSNGALYIDNCLVAVNGGEAIGGDYAIAEGTRIIADGIFSYRGYLTGISIPASVTHIGERTFAGCNNLAEINVAATTPPVIAANTFQYISTDLQITVPAGSESLYLADPNWKRLFDIASGVVEGICGDHLTWAINLADSTLTISGYGDMYDYDIWSDETYFPMPWEEFMNNIKHVVLPNGITSLGDFAFINESGILTSINLPEGIRRIGKYAIAGNSLTSISIPSSVEKIDTAAFSLSYELQAYHVAAGNQYYTAEDGVLFNKDQSTLIAYPLKKPDTQYSVPSSVNTIDYGAFWWCETLTSIILPEGITKINSNAFGSCTQLAEINIPNSVNYIGEYAFDETSLYNDESNWTEGVLYWDNCLIATDYENYSENYTILNGTRVIAGGTFSSDYLKSVTIPASVISIGEDAFGSCSALQKITVLAKNPPVLGANVFENVNRNIPLYVPAGSLENYRNAAVWNEFRVQAIPSTDLQTPAADGFESLTISNGTLHNPEGLSISIFDMQGRLIYNGTGTTVHMATGIYIVRIGYSSQKMFIP